MPLDKKVFYSIFSVTVIPIVVIFLLSANIVGQLIFSHVSDTNKTFLRDYLLRLEEYVGSIEQLSQEIMYEDAFINHVYGSDEREDISELLNTYMYRESSIESIIYVDTQGNYSYSEPKTMYRSSVYKSVLEQLGANDGTPMWYTVESVYSNRLYMARNVFDADEQKVGSMIFMLNTDFFRNINKKLYIPYTHSLVIVNGDDTMYTDMSSDRVKRDFITGKSSLTLKNSCFSIDFAEKDWHIYTVISKYSLYKPMIMWYGVVFLLTLGAICALYAAAKRISRFILSPMNQMITTINSNKKGEKTYFEYGYDDEFGQMALEFNEMIDELERFRSERVEEVTLLKEAQLKALQAQITPHFLFNCLDIINWEAIRSGNMTISQTVVSLSRILTVNMGKIDSVFKMSQELDYFTDYMNILEKRFENTVHITLNCDPDAYNCFIVPLTLQTLVENSWIHGLPSHKVLNVDIGVVRLDGELIINVYDDGNGMSPEKLREVRAKLSGADTQKRQSGIANLNRRIKLLYGNEYGIDISSAENCYTAIEVTLPAREE